jgi:hypothetical protein
MIIALGEEVREVDGDVNTAIEISTIDTYKDDDKDHQEIMMYPMTILILKKGLKKSLAIPRHAQRRQKSKHIHQLLIDDIAYNAY